MAILNKVKSGLLFEEIFSNTSLSSVWTVSPSDTARYNVNESPGVLRLKHGDPDLYILMPIPDGDFVFEIANTYNPTIAEDSGGIVAYQGVSQKVELLEYYDEIQGTVINYTHMRMRRVNGRYEGYGSIDNCLTWQLIGTGTVSGLTMIGIELLGKNNLNSDNLDIDYVRIMRDNKIIVGNLWPGWKAILYNASDVIISQNIVSSNRSVVDLNLNMFPVEGYLKVYDASNNLIGQTPVDTLWGGDTFSYDLDLSFSLDGSLLHQDKVYNLGELNQGFIEKNVILKNNEDYSLKNLTISVYQLLSHDGYQFVDISVDNFGIPYSYGDNILIPNMVPGEEIMFWLKITKTNYIPSMEDYAFKLVATPGV